MFEWRHLRLFFGVLLALPVLHVSWNLSREFQAYLDPSPVAWAQDLQAIIERDETLTLPRDPLLIVGGQRVALWEGLPEMLEPGATLVRALGDATVEDITFYYDRLIGYYRPATLVLVPGYADLHLRDRKSPQQMVRAVDELVTLNERHLATARVLVVAPFKMPLHPGDDERIDAMAEALGDWARSRYSVDVLDANAQLSAVDGRPDPAFYRGDGINLNDAGYLRVTMMLREALREELGADRDQLSGR